MFSQNVFSARDVQVNSALKYVYKIYIVLYDLKTWLFMISQTPVDSGILKQHLCCLLNATNVCMRIFYTLYF